MINVVAALAACCHPDLVAVVQDCGGVKRLLEGRSRLLAHAAVRAVDRVNDLDTRFARIGE
jgi:hypothetical protein